MEHPTVGHLILAWAHMLADVNNKAIEAVVREMPPGTRFIGANATWNFLSRGIAFAVVFHKDIVAGCTSYAIGGGKLDVGIATRPEHRRLGLAQTVCARMMLYCLERNIEPCWDAANETSAMLAKKLAFTDLRRYTTYTINPEN